MKYQPFRAYVRQRGISLIVVMIMLLLSSLVVVGSTRVGTLNEALVGSESDTQRAFAAAEAMIRDAEFDILGQRADGQPCSSDPTSAVGCRSLAGPFFPQGDDDLDTLVTSVSTADGFRNCRRGICLPAKVDSLDATAWTDDLVDMQAVGATYGQFTSTTPTAASNPLLTSIPPRAWYWVEVFRYANIPGSGDGRVAPDTVRHPFVYRITAFVQGTKPGTRVQLRSVFVPYPNPTQ